MRKGENVVISEQNFTRNRKRIRERIRGNNWRGRNSFRQQKRKLNLPRRNISSKDFASKNSDEER